MSRFEGIYTWFLKHLAGAAPSDDELLRLDELVHIYCNNKAKERRVRRYYLTHILHVNDLLILYLGYIFL